VTVVDEYEQSAVGDRSRRRIGRLGLARHGIGELHVIGHETPGANEFERHQAHLC
jgi:hypothetical protein